MESIFRMVQKIFVWLAYVLLRDVSFIILQWGQILLASLCEIIPEIALDNKYFCKLILIDSNNLIGFISILPKDCKEEKELTPWYATMYVKEQYRNNGYSRMLNDAILKESKKRNYNEIFLKTELNNYYEKFGAKFIKKLSNGEKLYKFEL